VLAALLFPLIMLWFGDGIEASTASGYGVFAYIAVAIVYMVIAVAAKPAVVFEGANKLGVGNKAARILVVSAALFMVGVPIGELGSAGYAIAMVALVIALGLFLWAVFIALFGGDPTPEIT
jgi:hypothetical protein